MELTARQIKIAKEVDAIQSELLQLLSSCPKDQINIVPFEGSWTAGQLAQHMIMSNGGFAELLTGPVQETERDPTEIIENIKGGFLNFNIKFESPGFIKPPKMDYNKEQLINSLENIRKQINLDIKTLDLSKTCIAFEIPVIGYLTRLEAIHFILYHTTRHVHQLRNIQKSLNK